MTTLVIGSGLIGSQVARILTERGEKPVLMDVAAQKEAISQIVDLAKVTLIQGPAAAVDHRCCAPTTSPGSHTAANPLLTWARGRRPTLRSANIMGTVNVLKPRVTGLKRVVVSSSSVLSHYVDGGGDGGHFGKEAFPRRPLLGDQTGGQKPRSQLRQWCGIEFAGLRYGAVRPWAAPRRRQT